METVSLISSLSVHRFSPKCGKLAMFGMSFSVVWSWVLASKRSSSLWAQSLHKACQRRPYDRVLLSFSPCAYEQFSDILQTHACCTRQGFFLLCSRPEPGRCRTTHRISRITSNSFRLEHTATSRTRAAMSTTTDANARRHVGCLPRPLIGFDEAGGYSCPAPSASTKPLVQSMLVLPIPHFSIAL